MKQIQESQYLYRRWTAWKANSYRATTKPVTSPVSQPNWANDVEDEVVEAEVARQRRGLGGIVSTWGKLSGKASPTIDPIFEYLNLLLRQDYRHYHSSHPCPYSTHDLDEKPHLKPDIAQETSLIPVATVESTPYSNMDRNGMESNDSGNENCIDEDEGSRQRGSQR
ncbi:hypothetical protein V8E54_004637 [Elaphomyces granulatus]